MFSSSSSSRLFFIFFLLSFVLLLFVTAHFINAGQEMQNEDDDSSASFLNGDLSSVEPLKRYPKGLIPHRLQMGRITQKNNNDENPKGKGGGPSQTSQRIWIPFSPPLESPLNMPQVVVALSEFTTTHQGHLRLRAAASFVNNSGFEMTIGSWTEPVVPFISASWIATDLPLWEFQSMRIEQHLNAVEWGLEEVKFSPPLVSSEFYQKQRKTPKELQNVPSQNDHRISSDHVLNAQQLQENSEFYFEEDADTELGRKRKALQKAVEKIRKPPNVVSAIAKFEQRGDAHWTNLDVRAMSISALGFTSVIRPWGDAPTFWVAAEHLATTLSSEFFRCGVVDVSKISHSRERSPSTAAAVTANGGGGGGAQSKLEYLSGKINVKFNVLSSETSYENVKKSAATAPSVGKSGVDDDDEIMMMMNHTHEILPPMFCDHPHVVVFIKSFDQAPPKRDIRVAPQNVTRKSFDLVYDLRGATESSPRTQFSWIAVC